MADDKFGGLTLINLPVDSVALATLAARTPIALVTGFDAMTAAFLVKRVRYFLRLIGVDATDGPFSVAIGPGNATQAEAKAAIDVGNSSGPLDLTAMNAQSDQYNIFQNSMENLLSRALVSVYESSGAWHSLGKGLPLPEGGGVDAWLFNLEDSAVVTGATIAGIIQLQGVWLDS